MNSVDTSNFQNRLILDPDPRWFIYTDTSPIRFPQLHYITCSKIQAPPSSIHIGGSFAYFCGEPFFLERCQMFENLYMPYRLNSQNFKIRNGALLWPRFNLYAYTDLQDPNTVYVKKQNGSDEFVAIFKFYKTHIELHERVLAE